MKKKILHYCTSFPLRKGTSKLNVMAHADMHCLHSKSIGVREPQNSLSYTESVDSLMLSLHFTSRFLSMYIICLWQLYEHEKGDNHH